MAEQTFAELEAEYCPPLDPALLSAILSDFDLSNAESVHNARATLDPLKESALFEEQVGFDASGTGGVHAAHWEDEARGESLPDTSGQSLSRDTDLTSFSAEFQSLDLEHDGSGRDGTAEASGNAEDLEELDEDTKIHLLTDLFGKTMSQYSIKHTLRKCNGRWNTAMEELLNHVYFNQANEVGDESKVLAKGIDAFAEENVIKRGRRSKAKTRQLKEVDGLRSQSMPLSPVTGNASKASRWDTAGQDIDFIVKRTSLPWATVSSTYHQNGATVPKTISALLKASIHEGRKSDIDESVVTANAQELGGEFPSISPSYLTALVRMTHPSTAFAHELAKAMTAPAVPDTPFGGLQIITNYQPPTGVETTDMKRPSSKSYQNAGTVFESAFSGDVDAAARARAYATARNLAFSQAQAAHRRAKSDRLMGGAAAYYGQVSRELAALSAHASAAAADELTASQSSGSQLDLHGVSVGDAVRIAKDKVERWWQSMGENRANGRLGAEERQAGFCIVVGLGRHSEGGKSKIGPAVKRMLRDEGWRFEDGGATILVRGRVKR